MATRTTSKKVIEAIRDDMNKWVLDFAEDNGMPSGYEPTPWEVYQTIKHQMPFEFARYGPVQGMKESLQALAFGDFMNAREHVQRWLDQTDAEAEKYSEDQSEELYCHLVNREFSKLVRKTMPSGLCVEVDPRMVGGEVRETLTLYDHQKKIANLSILSSAQVSWLKQYLDRSIRDGGALPTSVIALSEAPSYKDAPNPLEAALLHLAEHATRYIASCKLLIDTARFSDNGFDSTYYALMGALDDKLRNDPDMSIAECAVVDEEADRYFAEKVAKGANRDTARIERGRVAFVSAQTRADERNRRDLKPQVQNHMPVSTALAR